MKNQNYEPNRGTGTNSIALEIVLRDTDPQLLGSESTSVELQQLWLQVKKLELISFGYNASFRNYQITIGTKFVYLRFAYYETEATVYNALSPWIDAAVTASQGAMGSFGYNAITRIFRNSLTSIALYDNIHVKSINSGNTNQIGFDIAICTVKY